MEAPLLQFAGIPTFLRAPLSTIDGLSPGMVAVLGVPTDYTRTGRAGARYGPRGIREASLHLCKYMGTGPENRGLNVVSGKASSYDAGARRMADLGDLPIYPLDPARTGEVIRGSVRRVVERDCVPLILGGDHYISYPAFQGFADALVARRSDARVGYIQFDAHLDLWDDNPIMGRLNNATNARRISELPMVDTRNMAWIGTSRYVRQEQWDFIRDSGGRAFTVAEVQRRGIGEVVEEAWELASRGCDSVYLSIDIDCVECAWAPGTGTLTLHGMRPAELLEAMDLLSTRNIGAVDLVEVAPNLDPTESTQWLAASALFDFILPRISTRPE